jgi:hypothetical protein
LPTSCACGCARRGGIADLACATRRVWQGCRLGVHVDVRDAAAAAGLPTWHARRGGCGGVADLASVCVCVTGWLQRGCQPRIRVGVRNVAVAGSVTNGSGGLSRDAPIAHAVTGLCGAHGLECIAEGGQIGEHIDAMLQSRKKRDWLASLHFAVWRTSTTAVMVLRKGRNKRGCQSLTRVERPFYKQPPIFAHKFN